MKRILLVDDDQSMLQLVGRALCEYHVTIARDGFEALAIAEVMGHVDLLITDYLMPAMSGDKLIERARERQPDLQVLVLTGHGWILDREAAPWWQGHAHLDKPFEIAALRGQVAALIGEAHHASQ